MVHLTGSGLLAQSTAAALNNPSESTWLTLSLIITPITVGPSIAQAADLWGRKWLVVAGTGLGFAGCLIVSRADSIGMAIAGQAIAGLAQPTQALTHAIMSEIMPRRHRPHAQAAIQISVALASITALYAGGAMARQDAEGFRHFYYLVAAVFFVTGLAFMLSYKPQARQFQYLSFWAKVQKLDSGATILTIISFLGICIGLGWSQNPYDWKNVHVFLPFVIGICSLLILIAYALRFKRDGIYHKELFRSRNFIIAEVCFFTEGFLFLAFNNYIPYQISFLYGKDLFQTALQYSIAWYLNPFGAWAAGLYAARTKTIKPAVIVSLLLMAAFFATMISTDLSSDSRLWGLVVLYGFGLGMAICMLVVLGQLSVPVELIAPASGLLLATRAGGGTVGLAVYNAIFNAAIAKDFASNVGTAAISNGLPPSSLGQLLIALKANDQQALTLVPGINSQVLQASVLAMKEVFRIGFRNVYIMSTAMVGFALIRKASVHNDEDQTLIGTSIVVYCGSEEGIHSNR